MYQLISTKILVHHYHRPFGVEWGYTDCVNPILQVVDLLKKKRDMTFNEVSFVIYLFSDRIFMFTSMATSRKGLMSATNEISFALVSSFLGDKFHLTVSKHCLLKPGR